MQQYENVEKGLAEARELYEKILGRPAPAIEAVNLMPFPPGVDPGVYAQQELQRLRELSTRLAMAPVPTSWTPPADCLATRDALLVRMEIPGVDRDSLEVFVEEGQCVVRGSRNRPETTADATLLSVERPWGPFERRFPLPVGSDTDRITARTRDGILELEVAVSRGETRKDMQVEAA